MFTLGFYPGLYFEWEEIQRFHSGQLCSGLGLGLLGFIYLYIYLYICMINWRCVDNAVAYLGYSLSPHLFHKFCTHLCWTFGDNYSSLKRNDKWTKYTRKNVYCKKIPACYFSILSLKLQARILSWPVPWVRGNTKVSFGATVFRLKSGASGIYLFIYLYICMINLLAPELFFNFSTPYI